MGKDLDVQLIALETTSSQYLRKRGMINRDSETDDEETGLERHHLMKYTQ